MNSRNLILTASAALLAGGLAVGTAVAMPVGGLTATVSELNANAENVRWVCGPYRCWWRPGPYWVRPYPLYGYRYGWHGPRRHWW